LGFSWGASPGVGIKDFRSVFFGGIGIGGELEGAEAVLWLEGLLFWLEPEAIVFGVGWQYAVDGSLP